MPPNNIFKLLKDVDMVSELNDVLYFGSVGEQLAFFNTKVRHTFTDVTYQRKEQSIRVQKNIETLYDVSYVMFQNTQYSTRWYYGFIKDMKYKSPDVTEIIFEIDVFQTWGVLFPLGGDVTFGECYIEKTHTVSDDIGEHLVEENLTTGDYIIRATDTFSDLNSQAIVVASTWNPNSGGSIVIGDVYTGIFAGTAFFAFDRITGITALKTFLNQIVVDNKSTAVTGIFMMPSNLLPPFSDGDLIVAPNALTVPKTQVKNDIDIDGHVPKNNKLFVYPYNMLYVTNHNGGVAEYKLEYFDSPDMNFFATCNISQNPVVTLVPNNYRGATANFDETLRLADYAQCSWTVDSFTQYLASAVTEAPLNMVGSLLTSPAPMLTGAVAGTKLLASGVKALRQADHVRGAVSGGINTAIGIQTFGFYPKTIREEFAIQIDDHFTKYGYTINLLQLPKFKTRENWTYIKMREVIIKGNIPNVDKEKIIKRLEKGITVWHNDNVGDYDRTNNVLP